MAVSASNAYGSSSALSAATAVVSSAPISPSTGSASFSGTLNAKQTQQNFQLTVGSGITQAALAFSKSPTLSITVLGANGNVVGTASGPSVVTFVQSLSAGAYTFQVSGASGKGGCSFTLTVSYSTP